MSIENPIDVDNKSDSFITMIFKVFAILVLTCSDLTFMSVTKRSSEMGNASNQANFQKVNEKKIHFTGNSAQVRCKIFAFTYFLFYQLARLLHPVGYYRFPSYDLIKLARLHLLRLCIKK